MEIVLPPVAILAYGSPGRFVIPFQEEVEVRTSATAPAVPGVPTNVRWTGSLALYLQVFWLPVRHGVA